MFVFFSSNFVDYKYSLVERLILSTKCHVLQNFSKMQYVCVCVQACKLSMCSPSKENVYLQEIFSNKMLVGCIIRGQWEY